MTTVVLEQKWQNSRSETEGWSFVLDSGTVHWSYTQLFDARTGETSWGEASFDLASFRRLLLEFQREDHAALTTPTGGSITLRRLSDGTIDLSVGAAHGDGFACRLVAQRPGVLLPLGIDLAVSTGHA